MVGEYLQYRERDLFIVGIFDVENKVLHDLLCVLRERLQQFLHGLDYGVLESYLSLGLQTVLQELENEAKGVWVLQGEIKAVLNHVFLEVFREDIEVLEYLAEQLLSFVYLRRFDEDRDDLSSDVLVRLRDQALELLLGLLEQGYPGRVLYQMVQYLQVGELGNRVSLQ